MPSINYSGVIFQGKISCRVKSPGVNCPGGGFMGVNCSGSNCPWGKLFRGNYPEGKSLKGNFLGGNIQGEKSEGQLPWRDFMGGNCPWGS